MKCEVCLGAPGGHYSWVFATAGWQHGLPLIVALWKAYAWPLTYK